MRAILIDPFAGEVKELDFAYTDYRSLYPVLSHATMPVSTFELCNPPCLVGEDSLYVDEEGLLKPCTAFFHIDGHHQPLAGKGLILGSDEEGNTVAAKTALDAVHGVWLTKIGAALFLAGRF